MEIKQFLDQRFREIMIGEDEYTYIGPFFRFCFKTAGMHVIVSAEVYPPLPVFLSRLRLPNGTGPG